MKTDPVKRAIELRKTLRQDDNLLVVDFSDTLEGKDSSKVIELMPKVSTGELVFRTKVNVKGIDPIASEVYKVPFFDVVEKSDNEIEAYVNKGEFDFPLWFKKDKDFSMKNICNYNMPFVLQAAGCNFHDGSATGGCWYCFVDDASNNGQIARGKTTLTPNEAIDSMINARKKINEAYMQRFNKNLDLMVLRTSGGEPTVALDWILNLWNEVERRGLNLHGQIDTNLSTGAVIDAFEKEGIYEPNILEKLAKHPVKFLTALKGTDEENLQSNVQSSTTMEAQMYSLKKFLKAGADIYPQLYNPNPKTLESFLSELDSVADNLSLRVHLGPLKVYGPTVSRLTAEAARLGISPDELIKTNKAKWDEQYTKGCQVMDEYLRGRYNIGYKELTRSDVEVKFRG